VGLEGEALLADAGDLGQGKNLKPARVGQDGSVPAHEAVQPAEDRNHFAARSQVKVVGVAQDDLRPAARQVFRRQGLDRGPGAHRHEDRGLNVAVARADAPGPGPGFGGLFFKGEVEHHRIIIPSP
jgi:hypothetical protein